MYNKIKQIQQTDKRESKSLKGEILFYKKLRIEKNSITAITGSGGKTSLMFRLAEELSLKGKVLITTTTKIFAPDENQYENLFLFNNMERENLKGKGKNIDILGSEIKEGKLFSPSEKEIFDLKEYYDYIIYEADGSKQKMMKFWRNDEPCILPYTDKIIGVANIKVLGKSFSEENVHRYNMYIDNNKIYYKEDRNKEIIDKNILKSYLQNGDFFKNAPEKAENIFFLNGVETENEVLTAFDFSKEIKNFVFGSVKENKLYFPKEISAVVMGSGESKRFGSNKLLKKINGVPMIEILLKKLSELPFKKIIVTYKDREIFDICKKYPVIPVKNERYFLGQSESIKLGTAYIENEDMIFFTGDMPFLTVDTIKKIISKLWENSCITIPCVKEKRFSPVAFPNRYKEELMKLSGDTGGREIIKKENINSLNFVKFNSKREFIDIDTEEEFEKIER